MANRKKLNSAIGYSFILLLSVASTGSFAAGGANHNGGAGASNADHGAVGLAKAFEHSNNSVVNVEDCLHVATCSIKLTADAGTVYSNMGDIVRAAQQAGLSLNDFISTKLTITY